ncbi:cathepsin B-like cysteine proteinase 4 [Myzus persicae]|uniref:cathepsin B-like cysteine proteinase 4 n=1 Tax=Myzus persicae TaxID=13164 RepID=UPI000B932181|nr:cathepsin B-like cysteine proteinase 4 [Myzus persicae]
MTKIIFLISIMFLSFYLSEQIKLKDNNKLVYIIKKPEIPVYFDARNRWPHCKTIGEIHNQAYAATALLADRMCIATNGSFNQLLSIEEVVSCSGENFYKFVREHRAYEFFKRHGVVSGGKYNTNVGCQPLRVPPVFELPKNHGQHKCMKQCYGNKSIDYDHDHVKIKKWYYITGKDKGISIQKEILAHGPVVVSFLMYDDFFLYKRGVYAKTPKAKIVRGTYVKIIGWGVENGVDYWLVVSNFGYEFGENGLFKVKRGTNECRIEVWITGVVPDV